MNAPIPAARTTGINHPWAEAPAPGDVIEVAEGILWARLSLPMKLDHVNIYALDDGDGWTLIDTGLDWTTGRAQMETLLAGPLAAKPVSRVLMTHAHPDHVGLIGQFEAAGAQVLASRGAWLMARMMVLDRHEHHPPQNVTFRKRAGMSGDALQVYTAETPFNFADCVQPIPVGYTRLQEGEILHAAGRDWTVRMGEGHAIEHITLWTEGIVLAGDQILPGISPNIGVYATEPEANPLKGWLESCERFRALDLEPLVLPGHKLPFRGLNFRLRLLIDNHLHAFDRIEAALTEGPRTAVELMPPIFHREIGKGEFGMALVEAVAHVNYLHQAGRITRTLNAEGAWIYRGS
ncbi:MAG: MBL fold metallo-hydrolase [Pseudomonadota bacterium]